MLQTSFTVQYVISTILRIAWHKWREAYVRRCNQREMQNYALQYWAVKKQQQVSLTLNAKLYFNIIRYIHTFIKSQKEW